MDFPTSPESLGPPELTHYLRSAGLLAEGRVAEVRFELIGGGKMGDNARYFLSYDGAEDRAPSTLVAKFPAADERARTMAGAAGAYYNEVMFYRVPAPRASIRVPAVYGSETSADRGAFLLLLEDTSACLRAALTSSAFLSSESRTKRSASGRGLPNRTCRSTSRRTRVASSSSHGGDRHARRSGCVAYRGPPLRQDRVILRLAVVACQHDGGLGWD